jgi:basic membrane protein A
MVAVLTAGCAAPAAPTPVVEQVEVTRVVEVESTTVVEQEVVVTATPEPTLPPEPIRVAVIMPSAINDVAFSQSMYEALVTVQQEMGGEAAMELVYSENMFNVPDAAAAIRDYADQGYDLVIAHGSQYGSSLSQVAPDFPETSFAWGTTVDTFQAQGITNVSAYEARAQEGAYVLGTLAALMSESGIIAFAGPVDVGDANLFGRGFEAGALAARPDITFNSSFTGSFSDVSLMAAAAETHIAAGADMLAGSSQSVVGAVGVARDAGVNYFGTQWEQTALAPEVVVASQVYDWTIVLRDIIATRQAGVVGGKVYTLSFANGGLRIAYNDQVEVPAEARAAADAAIEAIIAGEIKP